MIKAQHSNSNFGIKEIAERASVSIATVDRVIHDRPGVSVKTKEKILKIIEEVDYKPNILASRLKSNKQYVLGILIPQTTKYTNFWDGPFHGVLRAKEEIDRYGIGIKAFRYEAESKSSFMNCARMLLRENVDGVLMSPSFVDEALQVTRQLDAQRKPYLFIDSYIPDHDHMGYIGPNLHQGGYVGGEMVKHTLRSPESGILVVNISSKDSNSNNLREIEEGFRSFLKDADVKNPVHSIDISEKGYKSIERRLESTLLLHPQISSIFVTNSRVSMVAKFLKETGRSDTVLVGFDYITENVKYLKENVIDFLICHKPEDQGFRGIMALYRHLLLSMPIEKVQFMPIDIVTKHNCDFYTN